MISDKDEFQFINAFYIRDKYEGREKISSDALIIAYKKNGEQLIQIVEEPNFSFYIAKPHIQTSHYLDNLPINQCDLVTIKYKDLSRFIAKFNGLEEEYFRIQSTRYDDWADRFRNQRALLNRCQANPKLFGSDVSIEDYYKMEFIKQYGVTIGNYKKAVFDIETDGLGDQFQVKHPINCLSYYDFNTDTIYGLYWDQPERWPRFKEFKEAALNGQFEKDLKNDPEINGEFERLNKLKPKKTILDTKCVFEFYESEFEMIRRFFDLVHKTSPDYAMAWNFTFDLLYMINRLKLHIEQEDLNIRLEDIICDGNVPQKYRFYKYIEDKASVEFYMKWHYFDIPGKTTYIDSMSMYANIRKSKGVLPSYALNEICMKELGKGKVDFSGIAEHAGELPHKDFYLHAFYNIRDTFLLAQLEYLNKDIDSIMYMAEYTQIRRVTKQTATLKNAQQMFYFDKGLAIGNNHNTLVPQPKVSYSGAIVADIMLNEPIITPLYSYPSSTIRPYVIDNDLTSMYPMITISHNVYKTTLVFQVMKIGNINPSSDPNAIGCMDVSEVFDNYQVNQPIRWGHDYLQLPDMNTLFTELNAELKLLNSKEIN